MLKVEVGRSFNTGRHATDFALVCDFANREALAAYHRHAAHAQTRAVVDPLTAEHWIADYELEVTKRRPACAPQRRRGAGRTACAIALSASDGRSVPRA